MFDTIEIKDVKNEVGSLVKAMRKQRGISQSQLAQSLDVSRTTIQNLENGKNFTVDTILKVIKEMDLLEQLHDEIAEAKRHVVNTKSMY
jgi:DNA-binding XRE family transcriptional regulator